MTEILMTTIMYLNTNELKHCCVKAEISTHLSSVFTTMAFYNNGKPRAVLTPSFNKVNGIVPAKTVFKKAFILYFIRFVYRVGGGGEKSINNSNYLFRM